MYTPCISFALNEAGSNSNKYEEYHYQISFNDLMVFVVNLEAHTITAQKAVKMVKKGKIIFLLMEEIHGSNVKWSTIRSVKHN